MFATFRNLTCSVIIREAVQIILVEFLNTIHSFVHRHDSGHIKCSFSYCESGTRRIAVSVSPENK